MERATPIGWQAQPTYVRSSTHWGNHPTFRPGRVQRPADLTGRTRHMGSSAFQSALHVRYSGSCTAPFPLCSLLPAQCPPASNIPRTRASALRVLMSHRVLMGTSPLPAHNLEKLPVPAQPPPTPRTPPSWHPNKQKLPLGDAPTWWWWSAPPLAPRHSSPRVFLLGAALAGRGCPRGHSPINVGQPSRRWLNGWRGRGPGFRWSGRGWSRDPRGFFGAPPQLSSALPRVRSSCLVA